MRRWLFSRKFNLFDLNVVGAAVILVTHDMWVAGLVLVVLGAVASVMGEEWLRG